MKVGNEDFGFEELGWQIRRDQVLFLIVVVREVGE